MYDYEVEKKELLTDYGIKNYLLPIRDRINYLIGEAGAANVQMVIKDITGSSWQMLAAIDYLHEKGEIIKLEFPEDDRPRWTQANVYTKDYGRP